MSIITALPGALGGHACTTPARSSRWRPCPAVPYPGRHRPEASWGPTTCDSSDLLSVAYIYILAARAVLALRAGRVDEGRAPLLLLLAQADCRRSCGKQAVCASMRVTYIRDTTAGCRLFLVAALLGAAVAPELALVQAAAASAYAADHAGAAPRAGHLRWMSFFDPPPLETLRSWVNLLHTESVAEIASTFNATGVPSHQSHVSGRVICAPSPCYIIS